MHMSRRAVLGGSLVVAPGAGLREPNAPMTNAADPVLELRQYKIADGQRDAFIALFEREFIDPQEALGIRLVGQFQDLDDPDRYTWIRDFPTMADRAAQLTAFYTGPAWLAHRAQANPMLDDNDNVLLLKPSRPGLGFGPMERRPRPVEEGFVVGTIHYLWKTPDEAFSPYFETDGRAALARAGVGVLGSYIGESRPNDFPRLPVRQGEKVFVWFARVGSMEHYERAMGSLRGGAGVDRRGQWLMPDLEERPAQVLRLGSAPRSRV